MKELTIVLVALVTTCSALPLQEHEQTTDNCILPTPRMLSSTTEVYEPPTLHKQYQEYAKSAGFLKEEQLIPTADLLLTLDIPQGDGFRKAILANHCKMLNDDGVMLEVDGKHMPADATMTTKIEFWWEISKGDSKIDAIKALKNICVLFMDPEERNKIASWAKKAGVLEQEIATVVDIEMRLQMTSDKIREREEIITKHVGDLGKNQYVMRITTLTEEERKELKSLNTEDYVRNALFWLKIYDRSTGVDHIKSLKNVFVTAYPAKSTPKKQDKDVLDQFSVPLNDGPHSIQVTFA